jgi:hypothetical protein
MQESIAIESEKLSNSIKKTEEILQELKLQLEELNSQYKADLDVLTKSVDFVGKAYDNFSSKVIEVAESEKKIQREIKKMITVEQGETESETNVQQATTIEKISDEEPSLSSIEYKGDFDEAVSSAKEQTKSDQEGKFRNIQMELAGVAKTVSENYHNLLIKMQELESKQNLSAHKNMRNVLVCKLIF